MKDLCEEYCMQALTGQVTGYESQDGKLTEIKVTGLDGVTRRLPAGLPARLLRPVAETGTDCRMGPRIDRRQVVVDTEKFQTNIPGIFAVGDINIYPGKKKLILSGFHEAALAAFAAAPYVFPEKKVHLQYTTTSPKLHKVLGVETPTFD